MNILVQDKSSYLKGLLILAKKDNMLSESEENIIRDIAQKLGFSSDFYEDTLTNLLSNAYLTEDPVKFSNENLSRSFIIDGLKLAHSDNSLHECEINWLRLTAKENAVSPEWFEKTLKEIQNKSGDLLNSDFALYAHL
jgi:hypothetical protein